MQPTTPEEMSIISLIINASLPVQVIMLILVIISVLSWTYIISKRIALKRARNQTRDFEDAFWKGGDLTTLHQSIAQNSEQEGPLARIFEAGMDEFLKARRNGVKEVNALLEGPNRAMRATYQRELDAMDSNLNFLASAGSVSPYIGLLGTVWGIMHSFIGLAGTAQATLAAVAPGIAEALIATAIGLFAAIPAVLAYNHFSNDIDKMASRFDSFIDEFLNILQRQVR